MWWVLFAGVTAFDRPVKAANVARRTFVLAVISPKR
jgi:hypothetical protein